MAATQAAQILEELNEPQREAVMHGDSPLLIVAGAGTGKTKTLAHRVAWQIAQGVDCSRILLLTFTRRAAAEMVRRVDQILREMDDSQTRVQRVSRKLMGGTFHSVGARLLRRFGSLIGLESDFTIMDRGDAEDLLHVLRQRLGLADSGARFPTKSTCMDIYSRCVNSRQRLADILPQQFPWCLDWEEELKQLFELYVETKERHQVADYDDLLLFWHALSAEPRGQRELAARFDRIFVDEYQDTNSLQAEILLQMNPSGKGLTVVGDDAQSIYSFRSATVRNILDFPQQFSDSRVVVLEQNYRSTQPILTATNALIAESTEAHAKQLWTDRTDGDRPWIVQCTDEDEQTDFVVGRVLEHRERGTQLKQQAVLFRASHHSIELEVELSRRNVPYHKYGGLKFIETAHVKDLLAFLKLAENPRDLVAGMRVLMLLPGVGGKRSERLLTQLAKAEGQFEVWRDAVPAAAAEPHWDSFVSLMTALQHRGEDGNVPASLYEVRQFYSPLLEQRYDNSTARMRDLEQIEQVSGRFPDRATFLSEITLDPPSSTQDLAGDPHLDEDYLILSTIHSAKGLEWDCVFVLHAADGNIPSDMATKSAAEIEEERRLLYVALTRARNQLYVCHPLRYYFHNRFRSDAHSYSQLSRFLTGGAQPHFETRQAEWGDEEPPDPLTADTTTADIRRRQRGMWS